MSKPSTIDMAIDSIIDVWCSKTTPELPYPSEGFQLLRKLMKEANDPEQKVCRLFVCKEDARPPFNNLGDLPVAPLPPHHVVAHVAAPTSSPQPPPPLNLSKLRNTCSYGMEDFELYESPNPLSLNNVTGVNISPGFSPLPGNENKVSDMEAVD